MAVDLGFHDLPRRLARGAEDVLDHVQPFDDFGPGFVQHLAVFARQHGRQFVGVATDQIRQIQKQLAASNAAGMPPGRERVARRADGFVHVAGRTARIDAQHFAGVGRIDVLEHLAGC